MKLQKSGKQRLKEDRTKRKSWTCAKLVLVSIVFLPKKCNPDSQRTILLMKAVVPPFEKVVFHRRDEEGIAAF